MRGSWHFFSKGKILQCEYLWRINMEGLCFLLLSWVVNLLGNFKAFSKLVSYHLTLRYWCPTLLGPSFLT